MVQVGRNLGPRHARVYGWAVSYSKNLDITTKVEHDIDVIGAASLGWALTKANFPSEMISLLEIGLEETGMGGHL